MNFLKSLFGDNIENENKTKPFHQNKTREERIDWFSRTRPWHKVDPTVIGALVDKFGDNPMFEVFVFASLDLNLVSQYEKLVERGIRGDQLICSAVSAMLYNAGSECAKLIPTITNSSHPNIDRLKQLYGLARDSFETAIILDERQVSVYLGIVSINCFTHNKELALKAALQGIDQIKQIRAKGDDAVLKQHRPDMWRSLEEAELKLKSIAKELA